MSYAFRVIALPLIRVIVTSNCRVHFPRPFSWYAYNINRFLSHSQVGTNVEDVTVSRSWATSSPAIPVISNRDEGRQVRMRIFTFQASVSADLHFPSYNSCDFPLSRLRHLRIRRHTDLESGDPHTYLPTRWRSASLSALKVEIRSYSSLGSGDLQIFWPG